MTPIVIVKLAALLSIFTIVVSIGLKARFADTLALVRNPPLGGKAMLAMFVIVPIFVIAITYYLPLSTPVRAALIALSISPMPPILPKKQAKVGGEGDYIIGLQVLASVVSIIVAPIFVWLVGALFHVETDFNAFAVLKILVMTVGAPLVVGVTARTIFKGKTDRAADLLGKIGMGLLMVVLAAILVVAWPAMITQIGNGELWTIAAIVGFALLVGHLLGGPDRGNRGALAVASVPPDIQASPSPSPRRPSPSTKKSIIRLRPALCDRRHGARRSLCGLAKARQRRARLNPRPPYAARFSSQCASGASLAS